MSLGKRAFAEFLGTLWLVFGGCGSAVLAAKVLDGSNSNVNMGIGFVGVAFAFGLTVLKINCEITVSASPQEHTPVS